MGIGRGSGEGRALEAAKMAINSPLLETSINGASGIIINITGGPDMTLTEVNEAAELIHETVLEDAQVTFGAVIDDRIQGEIQITVIATGFELKEKDDDKSEAVSLFAPKKASNAKEIASSMLDIPSFIKNSI